MEDRAGLDGIDRAEAVHPAHVVNAVHADASPGARHAGADHGIPGHQLGQLFLGPAFGAAGSVGRTM